MAVAKTVGRLLIQLGFDAKDARKGQKDFENAWSGTVDRIVAGSKKLAAGFAVAATALVGLGTTSTAASIQFNRGFRDVGTLLTSLPTDVAQERMYGLRKEVIRLAKDTGQATESLNKGLFDTISAGFGDMEEGIGGAVEILGLVNKAAIGGGSTVSEAVSLASAVTKAWGDQSSEATEKVLDLAFKTNELGQTTFPELAQSIGEVTGATENLGISQEELFGVYATLTGVTGNAMKVTTQYQAILTGLQKPTKEMSLLFEEFGVSTGKEFIETTGGIAGALQAVADHVDSTDAQMTDMFSSVEALKAVLPLTGAQAETFTQKIEAMRNSSGSMTKGFESMGEGVGRLVWAWDLFKTSISTAHIEIGNAIEEPVADILEDWTEAINENSSTWAGWAEDIGKWVRDTALPAVKSVWEQFKEETKGLRKAIAEGDWEGAKNEFQRVAKEIGTKVGEVLAEAVVNAFKVALAKLKSSGREGLISFLSGFLPEGANLYGANLYGAPAADPVPRAAGGMVKGPELALIGEAGPEAVVPLSKGPQWAFSFLADLMGIHKRADGGAAGVSEDIPSLPDPDLVDPKFLMRNLVGSDGWVQVLQKQQQAQMQQFESILAKAQKMATTTGAFKADQQMDMGSSRLSSDLFTRQLEVQKMLEGGQFFNWEQMDLGNTFANIPPELLQRILQEFLEKNLRTFVPAEVQGVTNQNAMKGLFQKLMDLSLDQMGMNRFDAMKAQQKMGMAEIQKQADLSGLSDADYLKKYGRSVELAADETNRFSSSSAALVEAYDVQHRTMNASIGAISRGTASMLMASDSSDELSDAQRSLAKATQSRAMMLGMEEGMRKGEQSGRAGYGAGAQTIVIQVGEEQLARVTRGMALRDAYRNTYSDY